MVIFPLAPDQTIAQMWSNGARGTVLACRCHWLLVRRLLCVGFVLLH